MVRSDSVRPTVATASAPSRDDEEHVDDREQRFHAHLEHHRHGEHENRLADVSLGEVARGAAERFEHELPDPSHGEP